jgi:hypothetical protein
MRKPWKGNGNDFSEAWKLYEKCHTFNNAINLDDNVQTNENFFIGKQWEGVVSNGLPTPTCNILKRVVCFIVSTITTDNLKINASPLAATAGTSKYKQIVKIINDEFDSLLENNNIASLIREFTRDAAVRGDGCMYTYWDAEVETGQEVEGAKVKGAICTEVIENTRCHFGNPSDRRVESQPFIIIERRLIADEVKERAQENGCENWESIAPDTDNVSGDSAKYTDDKVTDLTILWRDKETKEIWGYEYTATSDVRKPWNLGIRRYPIVWLSWDYIHDCYHGQAMITGLIPNQISINKLYAASQLSLMTTAFPKYVYDKTRVSSWTNQIGVAIGINGGDVGTVAKAIDPATIHPQVFQYIESVIEQTERTLGATSVALGDTRPDNTSAIIALQRAAATPSEITKQNLYKCIEDLFRIYLEFMGEYYGQRYVDADPPKELEQAAMFAGVEVPEEVPVLYDFSEIKNIPMALKLDVGASSYYSEIASIQTLDNLLMQNKIDILDYLERIPDGYIPKRQQLIRDIKKRQMPIVPMGSNPQDTGGIVQTGEKPPIPTGGGYHDLQRKVNETGTTEGVA